MLIPTCSRCLRSLEDGPCILVARMNEHGYLCEDCDRELMTWIQKGKREAWRRQDAETIDRIDKRIRGEE